MSASKLISTHQSLSNKVFNLLKIGHRIKSLLKNKLGKGAGIAQG
jgi:hypothetical protein